MELFFAIVLLPLVLYFWLNDQSSLLRDEMRLVNVLAALLLALSSAAALRAQPLQPEDTASLDGLAFMAGCWRGVFAGGSAIDEFYTAPSANLMLGTSRFIRDGRAVQFEFSRIWRDSTGVVLLPYPGGAPSAHLFRLIQLSANQAVFEAPQHDFPKRIVYTRETDGGLTARIDDGTDQRAQVWPMQRVDCTGPVVEDPAR